ncbi:hypothetical protein B0H19DRAFT_144562 [Mycena capillaripes]|nr:hypothetical protein B0H19DRAFT_144562 [Mycena capillaripes]
MLEADRARLADIEAEILRLERSLSALRAEQALLQERLSSYVYPVLIFPNEIMSEIFINVLPVHPLHPPLSGNNSPVSLTQICRQWRSVALATPDLWSAIGLFDRDIPDQRQYQLFAIWLSGSRSLPLSISVTE